MNMTLNVLILGLISSNGLTAAFAIAYFRLERRHRKLRHDYCELRHAVRRDEPTVTAVEALAGGGRRVEYGHGGKPIAGAASGL